MNNALGHGRSQVNAAEEPVGVRQRHRASKASWVLSALVLSTLACQTLTAGPATAPASPAGAVTPQAQSTPAQTASSNSGLTRADPFPAGSIAVTPNWQVEVLESVRGEPAWERLRQTNQFNAPAPEGFEYVLVQARVTSTHTDNKAHTVYATDLKLTGDRFLQYFKAEAVPPNPTLEGELLRGESAEGWTVFLVAQGEGNLMVAVDVLDDFESDNLRYLALDEGARIAVDEALAAIEPNGVGEDAREPAPLNRTALSPDWEITTLEVVRGAEAYALALETNQFNDPPAEGMEYVAVKVRARNLNTRDEDVWLDGNSFMTLGSDGATYDSPPVVDPEPALDARLYPGGEATGWIVVQAKIDDPTLLVFQPFTDFEKINRRYFSLTP
jgi:hypothetical protein